jgi:hypothetical protein
MLRRLRVANADTLLLDGAPFNVTELCQTDSYSRNEGENSLVRAISLLAYQKLYARPRRRSAGPGTRDRSFVAKLSAANSGGGTWEPGWLVEWSDDSKVIVKKAGLRVYARADQVRLSMERKIGSHCRLRLGKELPFVSPGFYFALGDADDEMPSAADRLLRLYANLRAEGALRFIEHLTLGLNRASIPFRVKVLSDPSSFVRADAAVIYLRQSQYAKARPALQALHGHVRAHLHSETPLFSKCVARGFGIAEDPGGGESFGMHRCRAVASALALAYERKMKGQARLALARESLANSGVDARRPYLNAGSTDEYASW